ncbi:MAG: hypothetical protein ACTSSP_00290 [Candidatus Asgardarchaeia archaeon]
MLKTMQREKVDIDVKSFTRTAHMLDDTKFDEKAQAIFSNLHLGFLTEVFLTRKGHIKLDIYDQIKKYDSMWLNTDGQIVAYWDHRTKLLHY